MRTTDRYLPGDMPIPVPSPDGLDAEFWAGTRRGELLFQRCDGCGTLRAPEWICHRCHSFAVTWVPVAPRGTVYAWERVWHPVMPQLADVGPYLVVVVELADAGGLRMLGNLLGDPHQEVVIGAAVEAVFEDHDAEDHGAEDRGAEDRGAEDHGAEDHGAEDHDGFTLVQWRAAA